MGYLPRTVTALPGRFHAGHFDTRPLTAADRALILAALTGLTGAVAGAATELRVVLVADRTRRKTTIVNALTTAAAHARHLADDLDRSANAAARLLIPGDPVILTHPGSGPARWTYTGPCICPTCRGNPGVQLDRAGQQSTCTQVDRLAPVYDEDQVTITLTQAAGNAERRIRAAVRDHCAPLDPDDAITLIREVQTFAADLGHTAYSWFGPFHARLTHAHRLGLDGIDPAGTRRRILTALGSAQNRLVAPQVRLDRIRKTIAATTDCTCR